MGVPVLTLNPALQRTEGGYRLPIVRAVLGKSFNRELGDSW
jgi:hypothetical protein